MTESVSSRLRPLLLPGLAALAVAAGLVVSTWHSYLLFHSLAEIFSVVIACGVFMTAWSFRDYPESRVFVYLGIAYLFMAIIDLFHTLSYSGTGVFPGNVDFATRLWIAARYVQALGLLLFGLTLGGRPVLPYPPVFAGFAILTVGLLLSVLVWDVFPVCFVPGRGLTPFKRISEYALSAVFAVTLVLVGRGGGSLDRRVRRLLAGSIALTILSELAFTLYSSPEGAFNLIGHLFKIAAFYLAYRALIAEQLHRRIETIHQLEETRRSLLASEAALREANASKDKFFSIIAHDMRNPLAGLQTVSEVLATRYEELSEAERKRCGALLHEGSRQAMSLMESLLQWARSQTGRLVSRPRRFYLDSALEEELTLAEQAARRKSISFSLSVPRGVKVLADPEMVSTVVRNLLSNSVKFTRHGGKVTLQALPNGESVEVSVSDTGMGMSREELGKLFRIDAHLSNRGTDEEPGNGLGLIVCREFVEKNGGRIWAESSGPGTGATFRFTLPLAAGQEKPAG